MTARSGQCSVCKSYYWQIDGLIVRHLPHQPVTKKGTEAEEVCEGSEKPPLGVVAAVVGR